MSNGRATRIELNGAEWEVFNSIQTSNVSIRSTIHEYHSIQASPWYRPVPSLGQVLQRTAPSQGWVLQRAVPSSTQPLLGTAAHSTQPKLGTAALATARYGAVCALGWGAHGLGPVGSGNHGERVWIKGTAMARRASRLSEP